MNYHTRRDRLYHTSVVHSLQHAGVLNGDAGHRDLVLSAISLLTRVGTIDGERRYRLDKRPHSTVFGRLRRALCSVLDGLRVTDPWRVKHHYPACSLWGGETSEI